MTILAVDTSSRYTSLALRHSGEVISKLFGPPFSPSEDLMHEIIVNLNERGLRLQDVDIFAGTRGPGSFTGLRVSMAEFKGFALALHKPLVTVPTLLSIERSYPEWESHRLLSVLDAKKGRFYARLREGTKILLPDSDITPEALAEVLGNEKTIVTGPDTPLVIEKLRSLGTKGLTYDKEAPRRLGEAIIDLSELQYHEVGPDDISMGPVYLRKTDAEEMKEKKEKKND